MHAWRSLSFACPRSRLSLPFSSSSWRSRRVAAAVIAQAVEEGIAEPPSDGDLNDYVESRMWRPEYLPIRRR